MLKHLAPLIRSGQITHFPQLLHYVSKKELMNAMGCSLKHINYLLKRPDKVLLKDIAGLSEAIGFKGWERVARLFISD